MRRLLYSLIIVLSSPCVLAQDDVAGEVAALRQLIENQTRLINDQSTQLESLSQRVAELEGRSTVAGASSAGLVVTENDPVPLHSGPQDPDRTAAIEAGEISLEHKNSLRTGKETEIVDDAVVLSNTVDLYGSMRMFAEAGA